MPMSYNEIPGWWGADCHDYFGERVHEAPPVAHFVEVGAWQGRSACSMAEHIRESGKLIRWDSIDTWKGTAGTSHDGLLDGKPAGWLRAEYEKNLRAAGLWRFVNPVDGPSVVVADQYARHSLDFVFIDGDHRTESVLADIRAWWPRLKAGGVMAGHDANAEGVMAAVQAFGETWTTKPTPVIWQIRKDLTFRRLPSCVEMPSWKPGKHYWERWLELGFRELGIDVAQTDAAHLAGWPLSRTPQLGKPFHVAALIFDGRRVWYDYSDYLNVFSNKIGGPYFKVQRPAGTRALPAGQFITAADAYLGELPALRSFGRSGRTGAVAMFSNIDELPARYRSLYLEFPGDHCPRRRRLVEMLRHRPGGSRDLIGLWPFGRQRPGVPYPAKKLEHVAWWRALADAEAVFALPGVCGDFTRLHAEALGIGAPLIALETWQSWPGNWRGCWKTIRRDFSDALLVLDVHLADPDERERERVARLGMWYYETELAPAPYAARLAMEAL